MTKPTLNLSLFQTKFRRKKEEEEEKNNDIRISTE